MELREGIALEVDLFAQVFGTADAAEGLAAFVEKREPRFTGS
jgi:enoyl-CoA hydratase/carnithine racemase